MTRVEFDSLGERGVNMESPVIPNECQHQCIELPHVAFSARNLVSPGESGSFVACGEIEPRRIQSQDIVPPVSLLHLQHT
jgi:hypothetical protein